MLLSRWILSREQEQVLLNPYNTAGGQFGQHKMMQKNMTETPANGYSTESIQRELSNEY